MKTSSVYTLGDSTQWAAEKPEVDLSPKKNSNNFNMKDKFGLKSPKLFMECVFRRNTY